MRFSLHYPDTQKNQDLINRSIKRRMRHPACLFFKRNENTTSLSFVSLFYTRAKPLCQRNKKGYGETEDLFTIPFLIFIRNFHPSGNLENKSPPPFKRKSSGWNQATHPAHRTVQEFRSLLWIPLHVSVPRPWKYKDLLPPLPANFGPH